MSLRQQRSTSVHLDPTAALPLFDAPAQVLERVLDVNVPWSFDDSNEESLMGDLNLDTDRMRAMFTKESMQREVVNVASLPMRIWNIGKTLVDKTIGWFEVSYAKVSVFRSPRWRRTRLGGLVDGQGHVSRRVQIHVVYIFSCCLFGGVLLFSIENATAETPDMSFIDAVFMATSSICVTGLATNDVSTLTTATQVIMVILFQLGSGVMGTIATVVIRRYYFRQRWPQVVDPNLRQNVLAEEEGIQRSELELEQQHRDGKLDDDGLSKAMQALEARKKLHEAGLKRQVEYVALGKLIWLVTGYILGLYLWAFTILAIYMTQSEYALQVLAEQGGDKGPVNGVWFAFFHTISGFNNAGFSLFSSNLVPFRESRVLLLVLSVLIAAGNTAFPLFLRFLIYGCRRFSKNPGPYKILLIRPRSLFTHLFPATESRQLAMVWIVTTIVQFAAFIWLNSDRLTDIDTSEFMLTAWFNCVCTRTAGFNTADFGKLHNGMLVIFVVMMYTSSYPFTITLHDSVIPDDKPAYIAEEDEVERDVDGNRLTKKKRGSFTRTLLNALSFHGKSLFLQHAVWLFLCWLFIVALEGDKEEQEHEEIFRILFEIASCYGTVGFSMGWSSGPTSFSAVLCTKSKLLIMSVMFIGRHRGLPSSLDPAISLFQDKQLDPSIDPSIVPQEGSPPDSTDPEKSAPSDRHVHFAANAPSERP
jgi:Trk-type K+ transport system membrane component